MRSGLLGLLGLMTVTFAADPQNPAAAMIVIHSENAWMKIPTDASVPDVVSQSIRAQRDEFWDAAFAMREPLTPENSGGIVVSDGTYSGLGEEVPNLPNRATAFGTFSGARSVLTLSGRTVYTEITIRLGSVFERAGPMLPGGDITVALRGGTVNTRAGVISFLTQPHDGFLQPGKTYLLVLAYKPSQDFYMAVNYWDITDGIAQPASAQEKLRAKRGGASSINGLTRDQLTRTLNQRFGLNQ